MLMQVIMILVSTDIHARTNPLGRIKCIANEGIAENSITIKIGITTCLRYGLKDNPINILTISKRTTNITKLATIAIIKTE